jgi:YidC/Oxa1 family membrane protein insertase
MTQMLYAVFIFPIVQVIQVVYVLIYKIFEKPAVSVIGVSFAVTILCLPLYIMAEKWQQTERDTVKRLQPRAGKIKAVFRGDEQYMILSTFYRQNHYHPVYSLRSSIGILIQIPFFIAAYSYLSSLQALKGVPFLFIRDLGAPDAVFALGNFSLNILPVAMTVINCIAGAVYTKGLSARDKIQIYGMAGIFLVLLYHSPSGLVLYWTMNNILSLIKNIFYKLKNPARVLYCLCAALCIVFIVYIAFFFYGSIKKKSFFILLALLPLCAPLIIRCINFVLSKCFSSLLSSPEQRAFLFFSSAAALCLLAGALIPSMLIASSPQEFSFIDEVKSPLVFIAHSFFQSLGTFVLWPACIFFLFKNRIQSVMALLFLFIAIIAVTDAIFFSYDYGMITNTFRFETPGVLSIPKAKGMVNLAVLLLLILVSVIVFVIKKQKILYVLLGLSAFSVTGVSLWNLVRIQGEYAVLSANREEFLQNANKISPFFSLSKDHPNLVIFMIDGAINSFFAPVFEEHPELNEAYQGFVLYPNTVSFANHTLLAVPAIYGGYEYTPLEMNKNSAKPLVKKHNEALFMMPEMLEERGYDITVTDPSWANYSLIPDITIYKDKPRIKAANLLGRYSSLWYTKNSFNAGKSQSSVIVDTVLWFSLLKFFPPLLRGELYDDGMYWSGESYSRISKFIDSYSELEFLPELTVYDADSPSALFITNEATHDSVFLQYPGYVPAVEVTDRGRGKFADSPSWHSSNAFYLKFGKWLEALKDHGVYDNTRIIVVADHGANVDTRLVNGEFPIPGEMPERYNPLLLVKDFNRRGDPVTDMTFMTNADVPSLALKDIVDDPVNPFTGGKITMDHKKNGVYITDNHLAMAHRHNKNTFKINDDQWILVRDNIRIAENWIRAHP